MGDNKKVGLVHHQMYVRIRRLLLLTPWLSDYSNFKHKYKLQVSPVS